MATYFNKEWLNIKQYKNWLGEDDDSKFAKCRVWSHLKNRFATSNMGERALVSHMKGKKHIQRMQDSCQPKLTVSFSLSSRLAKSKLQLMIQYNHQVRPWIILCMMVRV